MFHKITSIYVCKWPKLLTWFEGGEIRLYDANLLIERFPQFHVLEYDSSLFKSARIVGGGYGIEWNDELDLAGEEIYCHGMVLDIPEVMRLHILDEVRITRQERNMSQSQLEKASGVRQPVIARLERAENSPQLDTLLKVLAPLGKTLAVVDLDEKALQPASSCS